MPTRVRALDSRMACEITFPRLLGYRYDVGAERFTVTFTDASRLALSTADLPTQTENAPIVGTSSLHTLDDLKRHRPNEVAFLLPKLTMEKYFHDDDGHDKPWLFPQLLGLARRWLAQCVTFKDHTFPQLLLLMKFAHTAADRIYQAIVESTHGPAALQPILRPYDTTGSTHYVEFDTTLPVFATRADKCHLSHVVADTDSWEQKMAETLEDMPEVIRYVKNHNLGLTIPYTLNGEEKHYIPDFIVCLDDDHGPDDLLHLIIEVTGEQKKDKTAKVATARPGGCSQPLRAGVGPEPGGGGGQGRGPGGANGGALNPRRSTRGGTGPCRPPFGHDGTERRIERPQDPTEQTRYYSGKKKYHTVKNVLRINATLTMLFLSQTDMGSTHAQRMADATPYPLPAGSRLRQDLGVLAFTLDHGETIMPTKKPRSRALTRKQKAANRRIARRRVRIEHVNSSVKRGRIVHDTCRLRKAEIHDLLMEVCCALHNFRVRLTPWQPMA